MNHLSTILSAGTNPLGPEYVFVNESMDFFRALKYCRENFTELTRTWNKDVQSLLPNGTQAWVDTIGLVHNHWSTSFGYWDDFPQTFDSEYELCGVADLQRLGKWRLLPCETKLPFACYSNLQSNDVEKEVKQKGTYLYFHDPKSIHLQTFRSLDTFFFISSFLSQ